MRNLRSKEYQEASPELKEVWRIQGELGIDDHLSQFTFYKDPVVYQVVYKTGVLYLEPTEVVYDPDANSYNITCRQVRPTIDQGEDLLPSSFNKKFHWDSEAGVPIVTIEYEKLLGCSRIRPRVDINLSWVDDEGRRLLEDNTLITQVERISELGVL